MKGFTLPEVLLVVAAAAAVDMLTVPVGLRFFQSQTLDEATADIVLALRQARSQAVTQKNDSAFGVKFLASSFVVFQGGSYASRVPSEDETHPLPSGASVGGPDEVVFAKLTGIPDAAGTITVGAGGDVFGVGINAQGNVERQ